MRSILFHLSSGIETLLFCSGSIILISLQLSLVMFQLNVLTTLNVMLKIHAERIFVKRASGVFANECRCSHNLRLVDREKSKRSQRVIIYVFDERAKTYPKIPELITNLRGTTSRGKHCNLSGLFVVALHLRASDPMQNPRTRRVPPYISSGRRGYTAGPDSPQSPLLPVYCIA